MANPKREPDSSNYSIYVGEALLILNYLSWFLWKIAQNFCFSLKDRTLPAWIYTAYWNWPKPVCSFPIIRFFLAGRKIL